MYSSKKVFGTRIYTDATDFVWAEYAEIRIYTKRVLGFIIFVEISRRDDFFSSINTFD